MSSASTELDIFVRIVGFILALNGFYLMTEIRAIAGKNGVFPFIDAANLRRKHYGAFFTLAMFPSEMVRYVCELIALIRRSRSVKKKDGDVETSTSIRSSTNDEHALRLVSFLLGCSGVFLLLFGNTSLLVSPFALLAAWLCYVALAEPVSWFFPWHCLLAEVLFLLNLCQLPKLFVLFSWNSDDASSPSGSSTEETSSRLLLFAVCERRTEFMLRILLARLMLGFAKTKFMLSDREDFFYLLPFFRAMPVPSPLSYKIAKFFEKHLKMKETLQKKFNKTHLKDSSRTAGQHQEEEEEREQVQYSLPGKMLRALMIFSYTFFALAEIVAPVVFLIDDGSGGGAAGGWLPSWWPYCRVAACASVALLMLGINIAGNFAFFPLLTASLCIPAFGSGGFGSPSTNNNHNMTILEFLSNLLVSAPDAGIGGDGGGGVLLLVVDRFVLIMMFLQALAGVMLFPLVSWIAMGWSTTLFPLALARALPKNNNNNNKRVVLRKISEAFASFVGIVSAWRLVHPFGIFPPHTFAAVRMCPHFEWSTDKGKTWHPYIFKYQTHPARPNAGGFTPFVHPYVDWASFYPVGFSGGGTMLNSAAFVAVCPFRNYDVRFPVRVAQCLLQPGSRAGELFLASSLPPPPPSSSSLSSTSAHHDHDGELMVRCHSCFFVSPCVVEKSILAKALRHRMASKISERKPTKSDSADADDDVCDWIVIDGPQLMPAMTYDRLTQHVPRCVREPVRDIEWIHPEFAESWRRWSTAASSSSSASSPTAALFLGDTAAAAAASSHLLRCSNEQNVSQYFRNVAEFLVNDSQYKQLIQPLMSSLRSFNVHTTLFTQQQRCFYVGSGGHEWQGKFIMPVAYDLYKMGVKVHGPEVFSAVCSLILKLAHAVGLEASSEKEQSCAVSHSSSSSSSSSSQALSCAFDDTSAFMQHMASLAAVATLLLPELDKLTPDQDNNERAKPGDVRVSEVVEDEDRPKQSTTTAASSSSSSATTANTETKTLNQYLSDVVTSMQENDAGPCCLTAPSRRQQQTGLAPTEAPETILSVLMFTAMHAPSLRQEASLVRCLDAMAFVSLSADEDPPLIGGGTLLPGYFWFFSRWVYDNMPWDATDEVDGRRRDANEGGDDDDVDDELAGTNKPQQNIETAPHMTVNSCEWIGRQHDMTWVHERQD